MSEHDIIEIRPVIAMKELQDKMNIKDQKMWWRVGAIVAVAVLVVVGAYFLITRQTYTNVKVTSTVEDKGTSDKQYISYEGGFLKYGKDGASFIQTNGEEVWNHPYEMQNPKVQLSGKTGAIADNGGNNIVVFDKEGAKGEIETLLPIEKISVSDEGVVAVLMKDETSPSVICYDATGNVLVEHKPSVSSTGYPLDVAMSKDGYSMVVSYLYIEGTSYLGKLIYYNFGEEGQSKTDNIVAESTYTDTIIPSVYYINKSTSVAITDHELLINKGTDQKEDWKTIKVEKRIASTFHTDKYIGFLLQNSGETGYELRVYNVSGKVVLSEKVKSQYSNITMIGKKIYMYEGERLTIYSLNGIKRFEGNVNDTILEIFPAVGINKYRVINSDGMKVIRLVK